MQSFRNLKVWQTSHEVTLAGYRITRSFPRDELFGLTSQIRRACASVAANIAEGCGRGSDADMARFLYMAMGSASEAEYHFLLAHDLGFLEEKEYRQINSQIVEVKRMLTGFLQTLKPQADS